MKNKHILILLLATALLLGSTACHKDAQIEPKTPKVTEPDVSYTATTADFGWTVSFPGKVSSVVKVSRHADMSDATSYGDATPTSNKDFNVEITGLSPETQYYYCFEIWNPNLNHRSEVKSFTTWTVTKPSVTTSTVTDISWTTATTGGNVTDDGNDVILERGVCWGTSHNPDTGSNFSHLAASSAGTGEYSCTLTGLAPGTKYYVRAYATNAKGTAYGDDLTFTTTEGLPVVTTSGITEITATSAKGRGEVTDQGASNVTERGVCWGTSHNPTISGSHAYNGTGSGSFTVNMTGLTANTHYYVRAYAKNSAGVSYGNEVDFTTSQNISAPTVTTSQVTNITQTSATGGGNVTNSGGATVTERGICWSTSHNPTTSGSHANSGTGTGSFTVNMTDLTANTTYYVRAYAINSAGTSYGSEVSFTTQQAITLPTVTTSQVTNITQTSATGGGNVTNSGGATVTARGICWSTSHNPTIANSHQSSGSGTGTFTANMSGLSPGTTYYVRAYATNSAGTSYGSEMPFTTLSSGGGHAYVDLGLPSGTLWATCNVGANTPEEYGDYFAWGETQPKDIYNWSTYRYCMGSNNTLTKYCNNASYGYNGYTDNLTVLEASDDAATAQWGSGWRMPTEEEWQELLYNTTHIWTTQNGVNGRLFTATNGNSLFLPAAGYRSGTSLDGAGTYGYDWLSSLYTGDPHHAWYLVFYSGYCHMHNYYRYYGLSVRPVRSARQN